MSRTSTSPSTASRRRRALPPAVETEILVASRRRCCLCFHLDGDVSQKSGQIAHIDHDRTTNTEANLVFLCLRHHAEYDSSSRQSKGLTVGELQHAKRELLSHIKTTFSTERIRVTISIAGNFAELPESARAELLSEVLTSANVKSGVRLLKVELGSINFIVELTREDALSVLRAVNTGKIQSLNVQAVTETPIPLKDIAFAPAFASYSNGVSKREAAQVLNSPDNTDYVFAEEKVPTVAVFRKRMTEKYTIIVIADGDRTVKCAFPVSHLEVEPSVVSGALDLLAKVVETFGASIRLDGSSAKLRVAERVRLPRPMSNAELAKFLPTCVESSDEVTQIVCFSHQSDIDPWTRKMDLLFAIAERPYLSSLTRIGLRVHPGGGTFLGTVRKVLK